MRFVTENPEAFAAQLREARETILRRLKDLEDERGKKSPTLCADAGEHASEMQDREILDRLDRTERHELEKINSALARIKRGEFGKCLSCGEDIGDKRLKAMPTATQCMDCVQENH